MGQSLRVNGQDVGSSCCLRGRRQSLGNLNDLLLQVVALGIHFPDSKPGGAILARHFPFARVSTRQIVPRLDAFNGGSWDISVTKVDLISCQAEGAARDHGHLGVNQHLDFEVRSPSTVVVFGVLEMHVSPVPLNTLLADAGLVSCI